MTKTGERPDFVETPPAPDDPGALGAERPMTDETRVKLKRMCAKTGEPFDPDLSDRTARYRIAAMEELLDE